MDQLSVFFSSIFKCWATGCSIFTECRQKWERSSLSFHHVSLSKWSNGEGPWFVCECGWGWCLVCVVCKKWLDDFSEIWNCFTWFARSFFCHTMQQSLTPSGTKSLSFFILLMSDWEVNGNKWMYLVIRYDEKVKRIVTLIDWIPIIFEVKDILSSCRMILFASASPRRKHRSIMNAYYPFDDISWDRKSVQKE